MTSVSDESVIMNQVQDRDIIEFQLNQGKFNPVIDEIDNSPIQNLGTITLHAVECENCASIVKSNLDLKKELDDAIKQKKAIEREYNSYVSSQTLLYDQLKQRFTNSLEHAINILEEICQSDNEYESDSSEFVDIEN